MKMTPPWSRRRATQPASVTCCPASLSRSAPAAWLRSTNNPLHRKRLPSLEAGIITGRMALATAGDGPG
ncbi:hypothetical protein MSHI_19300 [Mycobacterium shinjukuense]|uniref:Uncharacterized protein n=1 Tax=Mycobacterium shinjukuense TaxID=398694 RepID=A0A7I7MP28_9MYCO|nr:hypothetical protein MSHI_19300 [Mycobacterium shinjukuense]